MGHDEVRDAAARAAFDALDDIVLVVQVDAEAGYPVVDANPAAHRLIGLELVGSPLAEVQPSEAVRAFTGRVGEVVRTGRTERYQVDREAPAGHITFEVSLCPLPDLGGDPPHVAAVVRDATVLRRLSDTLSEVERVTGTGTWTWDVSDNTVRWSSQLYDLFGLERGQLEPSLEGYLERIHPEDREAVQTAITRTFETGEPFVIDHRVVTPDDETRRLHCTGQRIDDFADRPVRMSGTAQHMRDEDA